MVEQTVYAAFSDQERRPVYNQKQTLIYLIKPWERNRTQHWSRGPGTRGLLPPNHSLLSSAPAAPGPNVPEHKSLSL